MLVWLSWQSSSLVMSRSPVRIRPQAPKRKNRRKAVFLFEYGHSGVLFCNELSRLPLFLAPTLRRCQREAGGEGAAEGNAPQSKLAVVAGIGRGNCILIRFIAGVSACTSAGMTWQLRRYGLLLGDLLRRFGILVILAAAGAIPIRNVALGGPGCRLCREVLQVSMIIGIEFTVAFTADLTLRLIRAGCRSAGVFAECPIAEVVLVISVGIRVFGFIRFCSAFGAFVPMVCFVR